MTKYTYFTAPAGHTYIWRMFSDRTEAKDFLDKLTASHQDAMEWADSIPLESAEELRTFG